VQQVQLARAQALSDLRQQLGYESVPADFDVAGLFDHQPLTVRLEELQAKALENRPDLRAAELGMPKEMLDKNDAVLKFGFAELEHCRKAGVRMAYGSDLLGALEDEQTVEFTYERKVHKLRRITIELNEATRDGDMSLHLLTNLPVKVSAVKVADLYRRRWTIETLFLEVTTTLTCEIRTLCYPKAALFAFCLALVAANAVAVIKAALRAAHGEEKADELSGYYLALEVKQVHTGMTIALPPACWEIFRGLAAPRFAMLLKKIATHVDLERYRKSLRGPKKPPPKKDPYKNGGHVSTHKLLTEREH